MKANISRVLAYPDVNVRLGEGNIVYYSFGIVLREEDEVPQNRDEAFDLLATQLAAPQRKKGK